VCGLLSLVDWVVATLAVVVATLAVVVATLAGCWRQLGDYSRAGGYSRSQLVGWWGGGLHTLTSLPPHAVLRAPTDRQRERERAKREQRFALAQLSREFALRARTAIF
jgi:hypothetical protein